MALPRAQLQLLQQLLRLMTGNREILEATLDLWSSPRQLDLLHSLLAYLLHRHLSWHGP
jgi:hypothetical protein